MTAGQNEVTLAAGILCLLTKLCAGGQENPKCLSDVTHIPALCLDSFWRGRIASGSDLPRALCPVDEESSKLKTVLPGHTTADLWRGETRKKLSWKTCQKKRGLPTRDV